MAKIPRVEMGNRPSSVTSGGFSDNSGVPQLINQVGNLAETGYTIAADAERIHAVKYHETQLKKQEITDTIAATRTLSNFEANDRDFQVGLRAEYANDPQKAVSAYVEGSRRFADDEINNAANDAQKLHVARGTAQHLDAGTAQMQNWAVVQQTQKAKVQMDELSNLAMNGAAGLASPKAFTQYIDTTVKRVGPALLAGLGPTAGPAELEKIKKGATVSFVNGLFKDTPEAAIQFLNEKGGAASKYLDSSELERYQNQAKVAFDNYGVEKHAIALAETATVSKDVTDIYLRGELTGKAVVTQKRIIKAQKASNGANPNLDETGRNALNAELDRREAYIDKLSGIRLKNLKPGVDGDPGTPAFTKVISERNALFGKKIPPGPKALAALLDYQDSLAGAYDDKVLNRSQYEKFNTEVAGALDAAQKKEARNTGPWYSYFHPSSRTSQQLGNIELAKKLEEEAFKNLPQDVKNNVQVQYISLYNAASKSGKEPSTADTHIMVLRALALATGQVVKGAF